MKASPRPGDAAHRLWTTRGQRTVTGLRRKYSKQHFPLETSARRHTGRGDEADPVRHARRQAKQQARRARRRGTAACRTLEQGAAGAAHLSKCMDALRPGDITTDYAASARWMGLAMNAPRANSGEDAARNHALCRRAAKAPRAPRLKARRSADDRREGGWGKRANNVAARAVGRSRTVRASPNSCMRVSGCRQTHGRTPCVPGQA